jgi:hypothetical protein
MERVTDESAPMCGCPRPLVETHKSCGKCGRDVPGDGKFEVSPGLQAFADLLADQVAERLEERWKHPSQRRREVANFQERK